MYLVYLFVLYSLLQEEKKIWGIHRVVLLDKNVVYFHGYCPSRCSWIDTLVNILVQDEPCGVGYQLEQDSMLGIL